MEDGEEGVRRVKETTRKPAESANIGPGGLIETEPPTKYTHEMDLGPLQICDS